MNNSIWCFWKRTPQKDFPRIPLLIVENDWDGEKVEYNRDANTLKVSPGLEKFAQTMLIGFTITSQV